MVPFSAITGAINIEAISNSDVDDGVVAYGTDPIRSIARYVLATVLSFQFDLGLCGVGSAS